MLVRWETERPFDGQLCREYVYQKLLKLDNPSSSYGKKKFVFFLSLSVHSVRFSSLSLCTCLDVLQFFCSFFSYLLTRAVLNILFVFCLVLIVGRIVNSSLVE